MKTVLLLLSLAYVAVANVYDCYPASVQAHSFVFTSFNNTLYKYSVPDLNLKASKTVTDRNICGPAVVYNFGTSFVPPNLVEFSGSPNNDNAIDFSQDDLSIVNQGAFPVPVSSVYGNSFYTSTSCVGFSDNSGSYCFEYANGVSSFVRKVNDQVVESVALSSNDNSLYGISTDIDVAGRINVVTHTCQYRGCTQLQYFAIGTNPLRVVKGPVALPHTVNSGCPVEPANCAVDVLIQGTFSVRNDIVTYVYSILDNGVYKVNLVSYDASCDVTNIVLLGSSLPSANRCSSAPGPNCWTCPANMVHWYDIPGVSEPTDQCACMLPTTPQCWTCPNGLLHWYDIPGQSEPSDKCACMLPPTGNPTTNEPGTHNCWTCPANMVHWYDIPGQAQPTDPCACMEAPHNCWTCPANMVHWYDIPGQAAPEDPCACMWSYHRSLKGLTEKLGEL
jgi:hypothetical protein